MKKALLIGKFNKITREINSYLATRCHVQLCSDNKEILSGMLEMTKPDLFVVLLSGNAILPQEVFRLLTKECPGTPIIAIGNQDDSKVLLNKGYLQYDWIRFLQRPVTLDNICKCCDELLNLKETPEDPTPVDSTQPVVLLVDDNPQLLRSMQALLSQRYKVNFATSGTQAIAAIAKSRPDIILLDYEMPVCNGRMTLQMLRSEDDTKDIPVVFLTGIAESSHVMEVMELHPQGYLLKPCPQNKLFSTIEDVLQNSAMNKYNN